MLTALAALVVLTATPRLGPPAPQATPSRHVATASSPSLDTAAAADTTTTTPRGASATRPAALVAGAAGAAAGVAEVPLPATSPSAPTPSPRSLAVAPISARPSTAWTTSGFLAATSTTSVSYALPAGPPGRQLTLSSSGSGSLQLSGCGLNAVPAQAQLGLNATACELVLELNGEGPISFTLSTEAAP